MSDMKYDVVIIGGGLGGLLSAYILCKQGCSVVVLEKNAVIGGCLQSFRRKGTLFDTGMHYIGSMEEGQPLSRFWKYFGLTGRVQLRKLDEEAFDVISYGGQHYPSAMGYKAYIEGLAAFFPKERKALEHYVEVIRRIATSSPVSRLEEVVQTLPLETEYVKTSVSDYISHITSDSVLRNVLAGNAPLYAGEKGKTPFYVHAFLHHSYIQSAYRIVGGSQQIADVLSDSVCCMGGEVWLESEVTALTGTAQAVEGVKLRDGRFVEGKYFISAIHPQAMIGLLEESMVKRSYCRRIRNLENTIAGFTVYLGFKKGMVPYYNSNFFHYDVPDIWSCTGYTQTDWPRGYLYMHQAPEDGGNFSEGALLISYMRYDEVLKWKGTRVGKRGEEYAGFKEKRAQQLIEALNRKFPGIREKIAFYEISTPLTYENYTATAAGAMYGIMRDVNSPVQTVVSQRTYIPNLFMTGQNTNSHGMLGVTTGAMLTCAELVGINTIIRAINEV